MEAIVFFRFSYHYPKAFSRNFLRGQDVLSYGESDTIIAET